MKQALRYLRNAALVGAATKGTCVLFLGRGRVFVDPADGRGRWILQSAGATALRVSLLWRDLARRLKPNLALDIGANYGEIGLSLAYEPETDIRLFEPNPYLRAFLERSVRTHRNRDQMRIYAALVSDSPGEGSFTIDRKWSGTSSAAGILDDRFEGDPGERFETVTVPMVTIDDLLKDAQPLSNKRLLFKIDVEGYEGRVWAGMKESLRAAQSYAGIVEFDRDYLLRAGTDPKQLLDDFHANRHVAVIRGRGITTVLEDVPKHCDLIIASHSQMLLDTDLPKLAKALVRG